MSTLFLPDYNEYIDQSRWYVANVFNENEVLSILKAMDNRELNKGQVQGGNADGIRDSSIFWLPHNDGELSWVYKRMWDVITQANKDLWKFDLEGFKDEIQYTEYVKTGFYDWHMDVGGTVPHRKLSMSVILQHPDEGGEFKLLLGKDPQPVTLGVGQGVIFPSYFLHKVAKVTKGTRKSLVVWVAGKPLK